MNGLFVRGLLENWLDSVSNHLMWSGWFSFGTSSKGLCSTLGEPRLDLRSTLGEPRLDLRSTLGEPRLDLRSTLGEPRLDLRSNLTKLFVAQYVIRHSDSNREIGQIYEWIISQTRSCFARGQTVDLEFINN